MKLYAVSNKEGDILAAARLDVESPVRARPVADEQAGHKAVEVYVPAEHAHYDLAAVCQRLKVDHPKGKPPTLKPKE
jgi:hypothetical protein